jgi:Arc/MetJ-type ribon-helix-helix transcriptional regulator
MASQNEHQLALRIPVELLAAIDAEVERVKNERPGARVQRSDVVREALMRAFFRHPQTSSTPVKRDAKNGGHAGGNGHVSLTEDDPLDSH